LGGMERKKLVFLIDLIEGILSGGKKIRKSCCWDRVSSVG